MNTLIIKKLIKPTKKKKQVAALFSVNIISIPLGIITNLLVTKLLGSEQYGDLTFINNIFNLSILFFTFGFYQAGNRALVLNDDRKKAKDFYGAEIIYTGLIFVAMSIGLALYVGFDPNIAAKGLKTILFFSIPFGWVFLLRRYFETLFQADNRIRELVKIRLYPAIIYFFLIVPLILISEKLFINKLCLVWSIRVAAFLVPYLIVLVSIKPTFFNLKDRLKEIWHYNKQYGLHVYTGSVLAVGLNSLTGVLISYFSIDNTGVGFYGLALTFSRPLSLIPNVIATTHYKEFSKHGSIPKKLTFITILLSILALIFVRLAVGPFIRFFYSEEFLPVINLNLLVSAGVMLHGMADYFNRFLGAHGQGKALRNSSILIGVSLLTMNLLLIPKFGETGAAFTKIFSGSFYLCMMLIYYMKLKNRLKR